MIQYYNIFKVECLTQQLEKLQKLILQQQLLRIYNFRVAVALYHKLQ